MWYLQRYSQMLSHWPKGKGYVWNRWSWECWVQTGWKLTSNTILRLYLSCPPTANPTPRRSFPVDRRMEQGLMSHVSGYKTNSWVVLMRMNQVVQKHLLPLWCGHHQKLRSVQGSTCSRKEADIKGIQSGVSKPANWKLQQPQTPWKTICMPTGLDLMETKNELTTLSYKS